MKRVARTLLAAVAPLLMAAMWMDRQPSHKPYQAPVLSAPAGSVPITGKELLSGDSDPRNAVAPTAESIAQGLALFTINCAMCHGHTTAERGPVGKKLNPPPPALEQGVIRERSDAHIYKAISLGFGRMPPFRDKLTPRERWDLVNFLRTRR